jgi:hypothetical protein
MLQYIFFLQQAFFFRCCISSASDVVIVFFLLVAADSPRYCSECVLNVTVDILMLQFIYFFVYCISCSFDVLIAFFVCFTKFFSFVLPAFFVCYIRYPSMLDSIFPCCSWGGGAAFFFSSSFSVWGVLLVAAFGASRTVYMITSTTRDLAPNKDLLSCIRGLLEDHFSCIKVINVSRTCNLSVHETAKIGMRWDLDQSSVRSDPLPEFVNVIVACDLAELTLSNIRP